MSTRAPSNFDAPLTPAERDDWENWFEDALPALSRALVVAAIEDLSAPDCEAYLNKLEACTTPGVPSQLMLTSNQLKKLNYRLRNAGEDAVNCVSSVHRSAIEWLNGAQAMITVDLCARASGTDADSIRWMVARRLPHLLAMVDGKLVKRGAR